MSRWVWIVMAAQVLFTISALVLVCYGAYWVVMHPSDIGAWFHSLSTAANGGKA